MILIFENSGPNEHNTTMKHTYISRRFVSGGFVQGIIGYVGRDKEVTLVELNVGFKVTL
jgi:hypothetical protein